MKQSTLTLFIAILAFSPFVGKALYGAENEPEISYCEFHITHQFAVEVVKEAYQRIGLKPSFTARPCRRSIIEANAGTYSGEVARIQGTNKKYENLIALDYPAIDIQGIVITKNIKRNIQTWDDLKGLEISIVRGELYAEKGTAAYQVHVANSYDQLLKLVLNERVDVGIVIRRDWELAMQSPFFKGASIHMIGQPLFKAQLYHHLHKDYTHVRASLNHTFKEMIATGALEKIHQRTMDSLTRK
ncbi:transporter substrate-binding domain-containing protein [Terasakiella sp. SH-1]|uniref:substrate-binding periplasmic protein n=1 Tax=Terasakiella sp. SH-1 TaxID=2560057 RepID=UPI0010749994|nr:transporter substrate-binding domain-containing protein [Terasakiella sp. SH-1]